MTDATDRARVRRSALRVGLLVAAASAIVIATGVALLVAVILVTARRDTHGTEGHARPDGDRFVVDVDHVLPWVIALGVVGVVVLGVIAWVAARWTVRPLAEALRLQRNFVSDASHELRTPLTALTSRIQIIERRLARGIALDDSIAQLRRDARVLDDVLTEMLLTAEGSHAGSSDASVAACVGVAVDTMTSMSESAGVTLVSTVEGQPLARIPATTLVRVCVALLDNAIAHAPPGSEVVVDARPAGPVVELRVVDAGAGIAAEDTERIFERFARGPESGRRRGFGLGLALVREAVTRSGGSVRVEQTSSSGTTLLVTMPAG